MASSMSLAVEEMCRILCAQILPHLYRAASFEAVEALQQSGSIDLTMYNFIVAVCKDLKEDRVPRNPDKTVFTLDQLSTLRTYCYSLKKTSKEFVWLSSPKTYVWTKTSAIRAHAVSGVCRLINRWYFAIKNAPARAKKLHKLHAEFKKSAPEFYKCLKAECQSQTSTCATNRAVIGHAKNYLKDINAFQRPLSDALEHVQKTLQIYIDASTRRNPYYIITATQLKLLRKLQDRVRLDLHLAFFQHVPIAVINDAVACLEHDLMGYEYILVTTFIPMLDDLFAEKFILPTLDETKGYMALRNKLLAIGTRRPDV